MKIKSLSLAFSFVSNYGCISLEDYNAGLWRILLDFSLIDCVTSEKMSGSDNLNKLN